MVMIYVITLYDFCHIIYIVLLGNFIHYQKSIIMKKIIAVLVILVMCMPLLTLAHPGHGGDGGYTITHYFKEPLHVGISIVLFVAAYIGLRFFLAGKKTTK